LQRVEAGEIWVDGRWTTQEAIDVAKIETLLQPRQWRERITLASEVSPRKTVFGFFGALTAINILALFFVGRTIITATRSYLFPEAQLVDNKGTVAVRSTPPSSGGVP
jgi:hypothetical protein